MILQVGGLAVGAISMRSSPFDSAIRRASIGGNTPSLVPSPSITRTSTARISRFTRRESLPPRFCPRSRSKALGPPPPPPPPIGGRLPVKLLIAGLLVHFFFSRLRDNREGARERTLFNLFS